MSPQSPPHPLKILLWARAISQGVVYEVNPLVNINNSEDCRSYYRNAKLSHSEFVHTSLSIAVVVSGD
jgi:hypothetical protein